MAVNLEDILEEVEKISKRVASDYPDVDWRDVQQELCVFVLENDYLKSVEEGGNPGWILREVAKRYCNKERAIQLSLSVQYTYRPSDVRKILESTSFVPEDAESDAPYMDRVDIASDIRAAFDRLSDESKSAIINKYVIGNTPKNSSYERKRVDKAIRDLTRNLNTYRGKCVPRRRAISNATARVIISEGR